MDTNPRERGVDMDAWREDVIKEARKWLGTPYQHKGRKLGIGVDCGGLLWCVYNKFFGPIRPFPKDYAPDWALHQNEEMYLNFISEYTEEVSDCRPGGVAVFKVGRCWSHGAIISDRKTFIHAWGRNQHGGVVEWPRGKFRMNNGQSRDVKFFDVKVTCLHQKQPHPHLQ